MQAIVSDPVASWASSEQRLHCKSCHVASQVCRAHRAALRGLDIRGRIYISSQGINAQYSGPVDDACQYVRWVEGKLEFQVGADDDCFLVINPSEAAEPLSAFNWRSPSCHRRFSSDESFVNANNIDPTTSHEVSDGA